jgi:hypothetical protein
VIGRPSLCASTATRYMADLEDEVAACRAVYVGAAVTDIAVLRGELFGRNVG